MTRRLSGLERQFYQQNLVGSTNLVATMVFDELLDSVRLQEALKTLIEKNPILSYSIVADPYIRFAPNTHKTLPYEEIPEVDDWRSVMSDELSRQYPEQQLYLIHMKGKRSVLYMGMNHALVDGLSAAELTRDLIVAYSGEEIPTRPHGRPVEKRFPWFLRGILGWIFALRYVLTLAKMGPALQIGAHVPTKTTGSVGFSFEMKKDALSRIKGESVNFFAVFCAIVLKSLHELYGEKSEAKGLSLNTPISLRPYTGVGAHEIGVFISGFLSFYPINKDTEIFDLARRCFANLRLGISKGHSFHMTRLARGSRKPKPPKISGEPFSHRPTVSISNIGRVEPFTHKGPIPVEVHGTAAQSMKDPFAIVIYTQNNRTFVDLQYSKEKITREEAETMLQSIQQKLAVL